jgi:hypothetical protein
MVAFLLTLVVSAAAAPAELAATCFVRALERHAESLALHPDAFAHREDRAASRRIQTPVALPPSLFASSPRLVSLALYTPPALAPRAQAATPSSQRDPPQPLA